MRLPWSVADSIAAQLITRVFLVYLLFAVIVTDIHMVAEYQRTKSSIETELVAYYQMFQPGIADALYHLNPDVVQNICDGMLLAKHVSGIAVADDAAQPIAKAGDSKPIAGSILRHFNISLDGDVIGEITLYSHQSLVFEEVKWNYVFIVLNSFS